MTRCSKIRSLLPLWIGRDVDSTDDRKIREHVTECAKCDAEATELVAVIEIARNIYTQKNELSASIKAGIAANAARQVVSVPWWSVWGRIPSLLTEGFALRPGFALASAAALLVTLAVLPVGLQGPSSPEVPESTPVTRVEMALRSGAVHIAWSNGDKDSYTVYKSSDPQGLQGSEAHVVRGHDWVDSDPESSPIVYYRIE